MRERLLQKLYLPVNAVPNKILSVLQTCIKLLEKLVHMKQRKTQALDKLVQEYRKIEDEMKTINHFGGYVDKSHGDGSSIQGASNANVIKASNIIKQLKSMMKNVSKPIHSSNPTMELNGGWVGYPTMMGHSIMYNNVVNIIAESVATAKVIAKEIKHVNQELTKYFNAFNFNYNFLMHAAERDNIDLVQAILNNVDNIDINQISEIPVKDDTILQYNALIFAANNANVDIVKLLIDNGANVNKILINKNESKKIIEEFDVLFSAINLKQVDIVKLLIDNGANVNQSLNFNEGENIITFVPLYAALITGQKDVYNLLINKGALLHNNIYINNKNSLTPLNKIMKITYDESDLPLNITIEELIDNRKPWKNK